MSPKRPGSGTPWGNGLVLFAPQTPGPTRRRRMTVLAIGLVCGAAVVWPIYPWFGKATPRILGLPFSLAWLIASLAAMFVTLVWLFRHDELARGRAPDAEGR